MFTVLGLPLHPLIVHATVVMVPAAAVAVALAALWPRFRHWLSWGTPAVAMAAVILVPLTTSSGESLDRQLPRTALIEAHTRLADGLLPWVIGLGILAVVGWWMHGLAGRFRPRRPLARWVPTLVSVLAVAVAVGTLVDVVLIGHSGAAAAWTTTG